MTPYQKEQVEIIRRVAEQGRAMALSDAVHDNLSVEYVVVFQHILDEVDRLKNSIEVS